MVSFIIVLGTQIYNFKMTFTKLINKSIAQKVMTKSGFGRKFYDLKYFGVGFCFILMEYIIKLRAPLQTFVENINLI